MTYQQKKDILFFRGEGLTYRQIGAMLGLPMNTVKSVCRRAEASKNQCRNCGKYLVQKPKSKPRSFCSDQCRRAWWKNHSDQIDRKKVYSFTCAGCGRRFDSYGQKNRKYCCHQCYISDRFGGTPDGVP